MNAKWLSFFLIFTSYLFCCVSVKLYKNYTLFRCTPKNKVQLEYLTDIPTHYDINFWLPPRMNKPVDFVMGPFNRVVFMNGAHIIGLDITRVVPDLQSLFDSQSAQPYIRSHLDSFDMKHYFRLHGIYQWLEDLSKQYPREVKLISIGRSHEERNILGVKIVVNGSNSRSKVIIEGGIHAREWISPAVVSCLIDRIVHSAASKNKKLMKIAKTYEWYVIPVLNPDGYEYSHTSDRLWRKNRHGNGVDLNRNFGHKFGELGSSHETSSEEYCGPKAFSEKETDAMASFVRKNSENLEYYLAFHSYSQLMVIPYSTTKDHLDNYSEMKRMCIKAAKQIKKKFKTTYSVGNALETVGYLASGASACWVKEEFKIPYVLTFELRDTGSYGFALPPEQIMPTCLETVDGLTSLLEPKNNQFRKLKENHQISIILDKVVLFFNMILFIIVRFF